MLNVPSETSNFNCVCVHVCMCVWVQECVCHSKYVEVIRQPWGFGSLFPPWFWHIAYSRLPGLHPRCCVYRCMLPNLVFLPGPWGLNSAHQSGWCGKISHPLSYLARHPQKHSIGVISEMRAEGSGEDRPFSIPFSSSLYSLILCLTKNARTFYNKNWWKNPISEDQNCDLFPNPRIITWKWPETKWKIQRWRK